MLVTYCASWALQNTNLAISTFQNIINSLHELFLDIVRCVWVMKVQLFHLTRNILHVIFRHLDLDEIDSLLNDLQRYRVDRVLMHELTLDL